MRSGGLVIFCLVTLAGGFQNEPTRDLSDQNILCSSSLAPIPSNPASIPSSQTVTAPDFIGHPVKAHRLEPKIRFTPDASLLHEDGGNAGSLDYPGPLGNTPNVSSALEGLGVLLWGPDGSLTSGYAELINGTSLREGLAAVDPVSLEILATWFPPESDQALGYAYMEWEYTNNSIVITSKQGRIYVLSRGECSSRLQFTVLRNINLTSSIAPGEELLNALLDGEGNIWFTTGGIIGAGDPVQSSSTLGYITPNNTIYSRNMRNQMVENGIAVNGTRMYVVTGPSGEAFNQTNAIGYMYASTYAANGSTSPTTLWSEPYYAGSTLKPNGFARGSGSTPGLLGSQYVAITDNNDEQVSLIIYNLSPMSDGSSQIYCSAPLFQKGASANEIAPTIHQHGSTWGVAIENAWHYPPTYKQGDNINGDFSNMTGMAPGVARIDVAPDGCMTRWEASIRIRSVPVLSTATGLFYGYM